MVFGGSHEKIAETEEGGSIHEMLSPQDQGGSIGERISQKDFYRRTKSKMPMKINDDITGDERLGFTQTLRQVQPARPAPST